MPTDAYTAAALIVAVVGFAALAGAGALIGFRTSTRTLRKSGTLDSSLQQRPPEAAEQLLRELKHCLHFADCIARDADALSALAARPSPPSSRELDSALAPLLKTMRCLAGRLQRVGNGELLATEETAAKPVGLQVERPPAPEAALPATPSPGPATTGHALTPSQPSNGFDDRKFPRTSCPGSFKATIYPPPSKPDGEPVQCTLLTRDISCGGIGVAHTEELYPKQIIVLHAVKKLLIGEVRWCRRVSERSYIAGCQLIKASG